MPGRRRLPRLSLPDETELDLLPGDADYLVCRETAAGPGARLWRLLHQLSSDDSGAVPIRVH